MNTAYAGNLVANLLQENWRRVFRKELYCLLPIFVTSIVRLQVQATIVWVTRMDSSPEMGRHLAHEERAIRRLGAPSGGDVHAVFEAPVLFGIPEVERNGMITNDQCCCTRWGHLQLSWWRRPLRLRQALDHERIG